MSLLDRPLMAALIAATLLLFVGSGAVVARARPRSWLVPLGYVVALAAALITTVMFVLAAADSRSLVDTMAALAWPALLSLAVLVVNRQARVFALRRRLMVPWSAVLAPIGAPSKDGRMLLAGEWSVPAGGAPLWVTNPHAPAWPPLVIGIVDRVWSDGERLMGAGRIVATADVDGLMPEVSIRPVQPTGWTPWGDGGQARTVFAAGVVTSVRMGRHPAFDGVWLQIDRAGRRR